MYKGLSFLFRLSILLTLILTSGASYAQILVIDDERVERESAAYRDFDRQVSELSQNILTIRTLIARGGDLDRKLAYLEERRSSTSNDRYEAEKKEIEIEFMNAQQRLGPLEVAFDRLRQEAQMQIEQKKAPLIRKILIDHDADVIMYKRLLLGYKPGTDVTTEFIQQLDEAIPELKLTLLPNSLNQ
ncbi:MAG: hypothetical protein WA981_08055 [Glaciecola sp.]